jgi:hypothetical protein
MRQPFGICGRTSIEPTPADGHLAAQLLFGFRKGPSVQAIVPPRTRTVAKVDRTSGHHDDDRL